MIKLIRWCWLAVLLIIAVTALTTIVTNKANTLTAAPSVMDTPPVEIHVQQLREENTYLKTVIKQLEEENAILGSCCANGGLDAR